jgi:hypothetical protein
MRSVDFLIFSGCFGASALTSPFAGSGIGSNFGESVDFSDRSLGEERSEALEDEGRCT